MRKDLQEILILRLPQPVAVKFLREMVEDKNFLKDYREYLYFGAGVASGEHCDLAQTLGKRGGEKGGHARAASLSPERRSEIAKKAAAARWRSK